MDSIRDEISMFRADVTCLTHQVLRLLASLNIGHCACPACSQALVRLFVDLQDDAASKNTANLFRALSTSCVSNGNNSGACRSTSGSRDQTPLPCVDETHNNSQLANCTNGNGHSIFDNDMAEVSPTQNEGWDGSSENANNDEDDSFNKDQEDITNQTLDQNDDDRDGSPSPNPILNHGYDGFQNNVDNVVSSLFSPAAAFGALAQLSEIASSSADPNSSLPPLDKSLHRSVVASAAWKRRRASTADKVTLDVNQFKQSQGYCHICQKTVRQLRQHMLVHSGEKPYACRWCSRSFNDKSNRSKHVKQAHPEMIGAYHLNAEGRRGRPPRQSGSSGSGESPSPSLPLHHPFLKPPALNNRMSASENGSESMKME